MEEAGNKELKVVNLMEAVGNNVKTEELVEGMQDNHGYSLLYYISIKFRKIRSPTAPLFSGWNWVA